MIPESSASFKVYDAESFLLCGSIRARRPRTESIFTSACCFNYAESSERALLSMPTASAACGWLEERGRERYREEKKRENRTRAAAQCRDAGRRGRIVEEAVREGEGFCVDKGMLEERMENTEIKR
ncbi:hypothetical protein DPEC_G00140450 [Dallia pectoralis]|uniref:Uncharacterized protein n=1 Tax=Dallia pectoralis TaxID=75939 RepID=A0ACC2GMR6_DALPE|nr:hypothetical protein DPEC_G00140450 [Dallia pectoralis]